MGRFAAGDVLLASIALDDRTAPKVRPVVVIRADMAGEMLVCPVSSKSPSDTPGIPISIDDFTTGGLDLFEESFVITSRALLIRSGKVLGKKGRLVPEVLAEITIRVLK